MLNPRSTRVSTYGRPFQELLLSGWILVPLAVVLGSFVAMQFFQLTPRYLKLLLGVAFVVAVVRLPLPRAVAVFCLLFPAPTFIFLTDTNVLFVGVLALAWLTQVALRRWPRRIATPLDGLLWAYLAVHLLSFLNVGDLETIRKGLNVLQFLTAGVVLYVVIVNAVRTERDLIIVLRALCWTSAFVNLTALVEYFGHGYQLVPEWFLFRGGHSPAVGGRVGGIFGFHGLLADWSAMMFWLEITMGLRATRRAAKGFYYGLALLSILMIALSVNRGGAVIWAAGGLYYLWLMRGQVRWWRTVVLVPILAAVSVLLELFTGKWLEQVELVGRITNTQFQRGIPDTRIEAWSAILRRIPDHLWIGHGPFYDLRGGFQFGVYWPHSAYLFYLYTTGVAGLLIFMAIVILTIGKTYPGSRVDFTRAPAAVSAGALLHIQVVMFAIAQVRDEHQRGNVYVYVMWILFGLAMASRAILRRHALEHGRPGLLRNSGGLGY